MSGDTVTGGALTATAEVVENTAAVAEGPTLEVITTAPGVFGPLGIVPVGTRHTVAVAAFSDKWMRPATKAGAKTLDDAKKAAPQG